MKSILLTLSLLFFFCQVSNAQSFSKFPSHLIDTAIIAQRGLQEKIRMLDEDCDWSKKIGGKIDVFWLQTDRGNFLGYVYEYIMDCDNLRLIYWYHNTSNTGPIVDFMIENLEDESQFVVAKKKHLKNQKK